MIFLVYNLNLLYVCCLIEILIYIYIYVIYVIMQTMCPPSYHHNSFVASHALGHMMYFSHLASVRSEHSVSHGSLMTPYDHLWPLYSVRRDESYLSTIPKMIGKTAVLFLIWFKFERLHKNIWCVSCNIWLSVKVIIYYELS